MDSPISLLPPELLHRIIELVVEGLPAPLRIRSTNLRLCSLVARDWTEPAQSLLESRVQLDSYQKAKAFIERPRRPDKPLVLEELVLFWDFAPEDEEMYPLGDHMTRKVCELDCQVRFLHLRSALFASAFDVNLLRLPSFRDLRHLKLDLPLEAPLDILSIPLRLTSLSLHGMAHQPLHILRALLSSSTDTLVSVHIFTTQARITVNELLLEALPTLPLTLRHLSLSTHWIPLSDSLTRCLSSCVNLESLSFAGVDSAEIQRGLSTLPSRLSALELTLPMRRPWNEHEAREVLDELMSTKSMSRVRFVQMTRRIEAGVTGKVQTWAIEREMGRHCACRYEETSRRPLP